MSRWSQRDDVQRGSDYDRRWAELAAAGQSIHGEADLIDSYEPATVLDAGCGTGRVAIELARRGVAVVGVDLDELMLEAARHKAPALEWILGDLAALDLLDREGQRRRFDVVALPGNVMIFVAPGTEGRVVANVAKHLAPGGRLIAGFQLGGDRLDLSTYDAAATQAGLVLEDRWATWARGSFSDDDYAVSVHRLVNPPPAATS